jgi:hypothetical protein
MIAYFQDLIASRPGYVSDRNQFAKYVANVSG